MVQKFGSRTNMGTGNRKEKIKETVSQPFSISNIGKQQHRRRFMGVRQSPSGRWVAEIKGTAQKIRLWLGTFDTAEAAAHAYDEAACLLRGANTRTNFWPRATGGLGRSSNSNIGSSSVLSAKVLNHLLDHLETRRAAKSPHSSSSPPSKSPLLPQPPLSPQHQQQQQNHNQELELISRMAYGELFSDDSTSSGTAHSCDKSYEKHIHDHETKGKVEVERAVHSVDMDLRLEEFSCFFAPFEIEGRERVETGTYEYWSMLSTAAKGV